MPLVSKLICDPDLTSPYPTDKFNAELPQRKLPAPSVVSAYPSTPPLIANCVGAPKLICDPVRAVIASTARFVTLTLVLLTGEILAVGPVCVVNSSYSSSIGYI